MAMTLLTLAEPEQSALRALLAIEPVPGRPVPEPRTFELLDRLVPSDLIGAGCTDMHGHLLHDIQMVPSSRHRVTEVVNDLGPCRDENCDGSPHYLGFMHWNRHPQEAEWCDVRSPGQTASGSASATAPSTSSSSTSP